MSRCINLSMRAISGLWAPIEVVLLGADYFASARLGLDYVLRLQLVIDGRMASHAVQPGSAGGDSEQWPLY